jgi:hypothetical protein
MKNQPKPDKVMRQVGAAEAFIDERMALGRVAFSMMVENVWISAILIHENFRIMQTVTSRRSS